MAAIPSLNSFSPNTIIRSSEVNSNFTNVRTTYNTHDTATTGVHGVTGDIVGTTDTQNLSNKTFTSNLVVSSSDILIDALQKIYLDGGTDTYIHEVAANQVEIVGGGASLLRIDSSKVDISGS